ncbi:DnaB-like dsDNA helicase [Gordonia phage Sixama]|uniref:DnaB-like dsDNA helicase n=1 Tax=Gordonia phage Sixama TaxID=2653271 RepID=A0A5Q2F6I8_9CAUD|nr:DnaB-like dsDNA helicase [Gordonia phage Sixama]QGF20343.1 DnaB-like dsDNA helicase [Gordonia phage Sixama]
MTDESPDFSALPPQPTKASPKPVTSEPQAQAQPTNVPRSLDEKPPKREFTAEDSLTTHPDDLKEMNKDFTATVEDFFKAYRERILPSAKFPYVERFNAPVNIDNVIKQLQRSYEEQLVREIIDYSGADELELGLEKAFDYDFVDVMEQVADETTDYVDVAFGVPDKELVLARKKQRIRLLAMRKAGKTTFVLEVIRCSLTGEPAFGEAEISPLGPDECIAFLDPEVSDVDMKRYAKVAFAGMTNDQLKRIKRIATPQVPNFDMMNKSTRDALISHFNKHNVTRVILDSYSKLMPHGSVSSETDSKMMINNFNDIVAATKVQDSFWVGHVNNDKEIRSSGSHTWDATFESLLAISMDEKSGQRTFMSQSARMTSEVQGAPIYLDPATKRPVIDFGTTVTPSGNTHPSPKGRKELSDEAKAVQDASILDMTVLALGYAGIAHHPEGLADQYGGLATPAIAESITLNWLKWKSTYLPTDPLNISTLKKKIAHVITIQPPEGRLVVSTGSKSATKFWLTSDGLDHFNDIKPEGPLLNE